MKILLIISITLMIVGVVICFAGCTTIQYGDLKYMRFGGMQIEAFSLTKLDDGSILVEFDKFAGEEVMPTVDAIIQAAVTAAFKAGRGGL